MAGSRVLLTVYDTAVSTCESLQITPDGGTAICATQTGIGSDVGCANGGELKFIAFPLPAPKPSRVLYQYRGACQDGDSSTLWTDASASSIIGVTRINLTAGDKETAQVGVITGGHFRPLNIAKSVDPAHYVEIGF
jgi:hypothetical protein